MTGQDLTRDQNISDPMAHDMILPRYLNKAGDLTPLQVNDLTCVEYRTRQGVQVTRMLVTTALFVVVIRGEKVLHTENGDLYIPEGSGFFARKGAYLFSENMEEGGEYHSLIFFIDDLFLADFLKAYPSLGSGSSSQRGQPIFQIPLTPLLQNSVSSFLPYFLHQSTRKIEVMRLKLQELLLNITEADLTGCFFSFLQDTWSERKQNLVKIMEDYYTEAVTVKDLADLSGRSLSTFKREFNEIFGTTPRQWITHRRLDRARVLLLNQDHNVSEACFEVGFENVSHFSRLFKKQYGYSPGTLK